MVDAVEHRVDRILAMPARQGSVVLHAVEAGLDPVLVVAVGGDPGFQMIVADVIGQGADI